MGRNETFQTRKYILRMNELNPVGSTYHMSMMSCRRGNRYILSWLRHDVKSERIGSMWEGGQKFYALLRFLHHQPIIWTPTNVCMTSREGHYKTLLRAPNFHKKIVHKIGKQEVKWILLEELSTSFDHFLHESPIWNMTREPPLEGPKLEHGAIGKDDSGDFYIRSAFRYFDASW